MKTVLATSALWASGIGHIELKMLERWKKSWKYLLSGPTEWLRPWSPSCRVSKARLRQQHFSLYYRESRSFGGGPVLLCLSQTLWRSGWAPLQHRSGYGGVGPTDATSTQLGAGLYEAEPNRQERKTRQELCLAWSNLEENPNMRNLKVWIFSIFWVLRELG